MPASLAYILSRLLVTETALKCTVRKHHNQTKFVYPSRRLYESFIDLSVNSVNSDTPLPLSSIAVHAFTMKQNRISTQRYYSQGSYSHLGDFCSNKSAAKLSPIVSPTAQSVSFVILPLQYSEKLHSSTFPGLCSELGLLAFIARPV